jgi:nicotinate-nucleotide pyrophosphorylase (carboxylating)
MSLRTSRARRLEALPQIVYEPIVRAALAEDFGLGGDITSEATVPSGTRATALLVARREGVLAGLDPALLAFRLLDPGVRIEVLARDGEDLAQNQTIATLSGDARALLGAERTALNLLSHMSGIATATAAYVAAVGDERCAICETRKTLPGLRALEKYAVRAGGGANHRFRLDDAVLIKDNHIVAAGGIEAALSRARERVGHLVKIEIEVDGLAQLDDVLRVASDVDAVLLDNFSLADLETAVREIGGRLLIEASGGITLDTVAAVALAGVDVISIGALTHSVAALDIALDFALTS